MKLLEKQPTRVHDPRITVNRKYGLTLNESAARRYGIKKGDKLRIAISEPERGEGNKLYIECGQTDESATWTVIGAQGRGSVAIHCSSLLRTIIDEKQSGTLLFPEHDKETNDDGTWLVLDLDSAKKVSRAKASSKDPEPEPKPEGQSF